MIRKLWYVTFVVVTIYLEIMYDSDWLLSLLTFELFLAAAMYLQSWYFYFYIKVWMDIKIPAAQKGEPFEIEFHIKNSGMLPVTSLQAVLNCENRSGGCLEKRILDESVSVGEKIVQIQADSSYSGNFVFSLSDVRVRDWLGLFERKIRTNTQIRVNVLPDSYLFPVKISSGTQNFPIEGDEYEKNKSGDDPSEIFQIRAYRPGDRWQRIHWKMSARTDELMTKEYSMPKGCKILIVLDGHQQRADAQTADFFLELVSSVSLSLIEAECPHIMAWYDEKENQIFRHIVQKEQDVYEMLDRFMAVPVSKQEYDVETAYQAAYPEGRYAAILKLDKEGRITRGKTQIAAFEREDLKEGFVGFVLEV